MKIFKFQFTKLTKIFIYIGLALCVIGVGVNIICICTENISEEVNITYPIIKYTLMFLIPAVLAVLLISFLASSYYSVDGTTLKTSFGIIKSTYKIADVSQIILDRNTNKLSVFFKNENFFVIVVKEEWYDEFIDALLKANPEIEYSIKSKENHGPDDEKKKKK